MNLIKLLPVAAITAAAVAVAVPVAAQAQLKPVAKISKAQAQAIALKAAPGKIVEADYEKENGTWRYSFDIRQDQRIHEIGVDANTGKIVESSY